MDFQMLNQLIGGGHRRRFNQRFTCHSVAYCQESRDNVDHGGKILLPPRYLQLLNDMQVAYPMLFKLTNRSIGRWTHCGVLEFTASDGQVLLPSWMMRNLRVDEGDDIEVESVQLPIATYSKFKPLSADFLDITNPKAVLEQVLRFFSCLTVDDVVAVHYNNKIYELLVVESRPARAVSIIDCDMQVDFDEADTISPQSGSSASANDTQNGQASTSAAGDATSGEQSPDGDNDMLIDANALPKPSFSPFSGSGRRLGGDRKKKEKHLLAAKAAFNNSASPAMVDMRSLDRVGIPNLDWSPSPCKLTFRRPMRKNRTPGDASTPESDVGGAGFEHNMLVAPKDAGSFSPFAGAGNVLKRPRAANGAHSSK